MARVASGRAKINACRPSFGESVASGALAALCIIPCGLVFGCSEDDGNVAIVTSENAKYAVISSVFSPEGTASYLATVPSLASDVDVDYDSAIEFPGGAIVVGRAETGVIYVGSDETSTLTEYVLESGQLVARRAISFQGRNVMWFAVGLFVFLSETKAYYINESTVVVWNPAAMEILSEFPLPFSVVDGLPLRLADTVAVRDDQTIFIGSYHPDDDYVKIHDSSRVVEIDAMTDSVRGYRDFTNCSFVIASMTDDGAVYLSTDAHHSTTQHVLGAGTGSSSCAVEIPAGKSLSEARPLELSQAAEGRPSGSLIASKGRLFFRARDNADAITRENFSDTRYLAEQRWWTWDAQTNIGTPVDETPSLAGSVWFKPEDTIIVTNSNEDFSQTALTFLTGEGLASPGLTVRGYPYGVVRIAR